MFIFGWGGTYAAPKPTSERSEIMAMTTDANRHPNQDEALARVNARRSAAPGHVSVTTTAHLPEALVSEWRAMSAAERGKLIASAMRSRK